MTLFPKVEGARARGADDVVVVGGGVIPADDILKLKEAGIERPSRPAPTRVTSRRGSATG